MHIISGLKKRCLGPATAGEVATGEAHSMFAAKKPTVKELREAESRQERSRRGITVIIFLLLPLKKNCCYRLFNGFFGELLVNRGLTTEAAPRSTHHTSKPHVARF